MSNAIENGDLYLLLAKNEAYTYNGDIFKTGRVRISLEPNPFAAEKPFKQTLDLPTGSIRIKADGVQLRVYPRNANGKLRIDSTSSPAGSGTGMKSATIHIADGHRPVDRRRRR